MPKKIPAKRRLVLAQFTEPVFDKGTYVDEVFGDGAVEITQDGYKIAVDLDDLEAFIERNLVEQKKKRARAKRKGKKR